MKSYDLVVKYRSHSYSVILLPWWCSWRYISHWQLKHSTQILSFHGVIFVWILQLATHHSFKHKAQFACKYQIPHGIILCFLSNFRFASKMKFYLLKLVMLFGRSLRKYFNSVLTDKPQSKNVKFQGYLGSLTIKKISISLFRSSRLEVFLEKVVLEYAANLQENTHAEVRFEINVAKQLYWNHTSAWVFCKFTAYFQNSFS